MIFQNTVVTVNYHNYGKPVDIKIELKPCPFCGSEARLAIKDWDNRVDEYRAECARCGAINRDWVLDPAVAASAWNRRILYGDDIPKTPKGDDDDD